MTPLDVFQIYLGVAVLQYMSGYIDLLSDKKNSMSKGFSQAPPYLRTLPKRKVLSTVRV